MIVSPYRLLRMRRNAAFLADQTLWWHHGLLFHRAGERLRFVYDWRRAQFETEEGWESWLAQEGCPILRSTVELVPRPVCGCCARLHRTSDWKNAQPPIEVVPDPDPTRAEYRCERHVGRSPCCIAGCGKTFDNKGRYEVTYICGRHWRMAPRWMRDRNRRFERMLKPRRKPLDPRRRERIEDLAWKSWHACIRAVERRLQGGGLDFDEIEKLLGFGRDDFNHEGDEDDDA